MPMLAEKRVKSNFMPSSQKALKTRWTGDGFGMRMLEKMGWSDGKGLGVNEDGQTDPIGLKLKSDLRGIGFTARREDKAIMAVSQQLEFEALLAGLDNLDSTRKNEQAETSERISTSSLELKSKASRARVHYQKFTRGKDLSRASSKDLACILGINIHKEAPTEPDVIADVGPPIPAPTFGITTIERENSTDYFRKRLEDKKKKNATACLEDVDGSEKNGESDETDFNNSVASENKEVIISEIDSNGQNVDNSKKHKKKKDCRKVPVDDSEVNSSILKDGESTSTPSTNRRKSVTWGDVEVSFVSKYIKDMADTSTESLDDEFSSEIIDCPEATALNGCEKKKKKKKKKEKKAMGVERTADNMDELRGQEDCGYQVCFVDISKKTKKRKNKQESSLSENHVSDAQEDKDIECEKNLNEECEAFENNLDVCSENDSKKIKKKKKKQESSLSEGHLSKEKLTGECEANSLDVCSDNDSKKAKKRKKKQDSSLSEDHVSVTQGEEDIECKENLTGECEAFENNTDVSPKKKKEKKKKESAIDTCQGEDFNNSGCGDFRQDCKPDDNTSTKKRKKSKDKLRTRDTDSDECFSTEKKKELNNDGLISEIERTEIEQDNAIITDFDSDSRTKRKKRKNEECSAQIGSYEICSGSKKKKKIEKETEVGNVCEINDLTNKFNERAHSTESFAGNDGIQVEKKLKIPSSNNAAKVSSETNLGTKIVSSLTTSKKIPPKNIENKNKDMSFIKQMKSNQVLYASNYNHRKVFIALGYDVKKLMKDGFVNVEMPPSNFPGSSLDSVEGYGNNNVSSS